jgi:deoxyribonuclease-4
MPTNGGLASALTSGAEIGCTAVQLFTANPKQWHHTPLSEEEVESFHNAREATGIVFTCAHDSYLINLAAPDQKTHSTSLGAFRREIERADRLRIPWVVTHMGAHVSSGEEAGLERLIASVRQLLQDTDGKSAGIALETTAGQGTGLGYTFEQLGRVLDGVGDHLRLGVCLDTCHVFAAGYDLTTEDGYRDLWARFNAVVGRGRLRIVHCNDAKKPLGSRIDRHEHIGQGQIGLEPFRWLVNDPELRDVPLIVETPEAETMHGVNLDTLRGLATPE